MKPKKKRVVDTQTGIISDQSILLTGYYSPKHYPEMIKVVVYEYFEKE